MVFEEILSSEIEVGKAVKAELFTKAKNSLDDHELRLSAVETSSLLTEIFDVDIWNAGAVTSLTNLLMYKAKKALRVTKVELQIYTKGSISSGIIELDVKKATSLDPSFFATIMSTTAKINFATAANYDLNDGTIDSTQNSLNAGDYLRCDILSLPSTPVGKFRIVVYGEGTI